MSMRLVGLLHMHLRASVALQAIAATIALTCLLPANVTAAVTPTAKAVASEASKTCKKLREISQLNRQEIERRNAKISNWQSAELKKYKLNYSAAGDSGFYNWPAVDMDQGGRPDTVRASCGAPGWDMRCTMIVKSEESSKEFSIQRGFMYVSQLNGRYYVIWDHFGKKSRVNTRDLSEYFAVDLVGIKQICQ